MWGPHGSLAEETLFAQIQNLVHVQTIARRRHDYRKDGLAIGNVCPGAQVRSSVLSLGGQIADESQKQVELARLLSQLASPPSQLSPSSSHLAWIAFSLFFPIDLKNLK